MHLSAHLIRFKCTLLCSVITYCLIIVLYLRLNSHICCFFNFPDVDTHNSRLLFQVLMLFLRDRNENQSSPGCSGIILSPSAWGCVGTGVVPGYLYTTKNCSTGNKSIQNQVTSVKERPRQRRLKPKLAIAPIHSTIFSHSSIEKKKKKTRGNSLKCNAGTPNQVLGG